MLVKRILSLIAVIAFIGLGGSLSLAGNLTKEVKMSIRVGKEAPDFEATAFYQGGFKKIKLSDFRGKWLVLCFYPGDFTFV